MILIWILLLGAVIATLLFAEARKHKILRLSELGDSSQIFFEPLYLKQEKQLGMNHPVLNDISRENPQLEYEVLQRIGGGTYGDVYKSRRIATSSLVAIKIIKFEPGDDLSIILQEIVVMKELNHANIVAYYGAYMRQSRLWICMEFCSGGSLQDIYHAIGPLPEKHIAFVLKETLKGLAYLHQMGKMHRDIKGANILLTEEGEVKLADFGVSAQITTTLSKRKSFIGSPYWMSPEIAAVERKGGYNQQCDIWSLGITSIELAELQPPLFDLHPMRALYLLSKSSYKPPQLKDRIKWSLDYHSFVKLALTKNPKKRPAADKLLDHTFVRQANLGHALGRDLIDQARNPRRGPGSDIGSVSEQDAEEDGGISHLKRIPSKKPTDDKSQNGDKGSPNFPSVLARFRSNGDSRHSPESVYLPTLDESPLDSDAQDRTLVRAPPPPVPLRNRSPSHNLRPKSTPVLPSMISSSAGVSSFSSDDGRIEFDEDESCATLRVAHSRMSYNPVLDHGRGRGEWIEEVHGPPAPPPRTKHMKKKLQEQLGSSANFLANGLPPTPRVHMGACFSKIFNECPLHINAAASWVHPVTRDQHILIAAEEGLYTLNLNELHELAMDLLHNRRCTWLHVTKDVLMTISGKTPHLYRHDLVSLHGRHFNRFSLSMNKFPEKFMPRKFVTSGKVAETKGCLRCCVGRNASYGNKYLAAAMPSNVILMQWYEPMNKFMMLRQIDWRLPSPFNAFYMLVTDAEFPVVCVGVRPLMGDDGAQFEIVDFNNSFITVTNANAPSISNAYLEVTNMNQLDAGTITLCHDNIVKLVDTVGRLKMDDSIPVVEYHFDFMISSLVCLSDGLLAFHRHGMQGRSFSTDEVTQDIVDESKIYRLVGADRLIVVESRQVAHPSAPGNLYIVSGHENNF